MTRSNLIELAGLPFATTLIPTGIATAKAAATCSTMVDKVLSLEKVKDIRELRPVLQRG